MKKGKIKFLFSTLILILLTGFLFLREQSDGMLHLYFCDVGQGDAVYIRFPDNSDMLVDGGPNNNVLECLSKNMPFYDRWIDVVMLTHPQADHLNGLISVLERYEISYFIASPVGNSTLNYQKMQDILSRKKITVRNLYSGQIIDFGRVKFTSLWPERNWLISHVKCTNGGCSQLVSENSRTLGVSTDTLDLNDFSLMGILSYGAFDVLLTGDGGIKIQNEILKDYNKYIDIEVIKIPHHGAKTGLSEEFLKTFRSELAVISVGRNNRYGHPAGEILQMLSRHVRLIKRTDLDGTIEVVSDGFSWGLGRLQIRAN